MDQRVGLLAFLLLLFACLVSTALVSLLPDGSTACKANILLVNTATYGTNAGLHPATPQCSNFYGGAWWGSLVAPAGTTIVFSTENPYTSFPAYIILYSGTCDELSCLAVSQSPEPETSAYLGTSLTWRSNGELVYLAVTGTQSSSAAGEFLLNITASTISTSSCSSPMVIPLEYDPLNLVGGSMDYGVTYQSRCNPSTNTDTVWYQLVAPPTEPVHFWARTCWDDNDFGLAVDWDNTLVSLFSGSCSSLTCVSGPRCKASTFLAPNQTATIGIIKASQSVVTSFVLGLAVAPVYQTSCDDPDDIYFTTSTLNIATNISTVGQDPIQSDPCGKAFGPAYWFYVEVPTPNYNFTISTCSSYTTFDTVLLAYTGSCSSLRCAYYNDDGNCPNKGQSVLSIVTNSYYYYIVVAGFNGQTGSAEVSFSIRPV